MGGVLIWPILKCSMTFTIARRAGGTARLRGREGRRANMCGTKIAVAALSVYSCCVVGYFVYLSARRHGTLHPRNTQAEGLVQFRANEWLSTRSAECEV